MIIDRDCKTTELICARSKLSKVILCYSIYLLVKYFILFLVEKSLTNIYCRKHKNLDFSVECWFSDGWWEGEVECPIPGAKRTFSIKLRLLTIANSREWPTTNYELSLTIHIEKSNKQLKHPHLRSNDYR